MVRPKKVRSGLSWCRQFFNYGGESKMVVRQGLVSVLFLIKKYFYFLVVLFF
jgi:hypothetical protein